MNCLKVLERSKPSTGFDGLENQNLWCAYNQCFCGTSSTLIPLIYLQYFHHVPTTKFNLFVGLNLLISFLRTNHQLFEFNANKK